LATGLLKASEAPPGANGLMNTILLLLAGQGSAAIDGKDKLTIGQIQTNNFAIKRIDTPAKFLQQKMGNLDVLGYFN
jgi:hypothetical protein